MPTDTAPAPLLDLPGASTGTPLVMLHGWTGSAADFAPVVGPLSADRRVVVPPLPGHGGAPPAAEPSGYGLSAMVTHVEGVLDRLGIEDFHLLGHSLGGLLAQRLAMRQAHRVTALVLLGCGPGRPADHTADRIERVALAARDHGVEAGWAAVVAAAPGWEDDPRAAMVRDRFLAMPAEAVVGAARAVLNASPVGAFLRGIDVPTMVVHGEGDDSWLPPQQRDLARRIPGADYVVIPGAMHSPAVENPPALLQVLTPFLSAADPQER